MPVIAICLVHGPFESAAISITNSRNVRFSGNQESCPQCGRTSAVMDGVFDFDADGLATILSAPAWSIHALEAVQRDIRMTVDAAESVPASQGSLVRELLERIETRDEKLADLIAKEVKGKPPATILVILRNILAALGAVVTLKEAGQYGYEVVRGIIGAVFSG